jgi:hypothetical protein
MPKPEGGDKAEISATVREFGPGWDVGVSWGSTTWGWVDISGPGTNVSVMAQSNGHLNFYASEPGKWRVAFREPFGGGPGDELAVTGLVVE